MNRRDSVLGLLALGASLRPLAARAQKKPEMPARIGFLSPSSAARNSPSLVCFRNALRDAGWIEGKNMTIEYRFAENVASRYPELAVELAGLPLDLVVANGTPGIQAMHRATRTMPVVMVAVSDPVKSGVIASLARPGGNITGVSNFLPATSGKLIEFLRLVAPKLARFGVLHNPDNAGKLLEIEELRVAAKSVGVAIHPLEARSASELEAALPAALKARCDSLVVLQEGVTFAGRETIAQFAAKNRLPAIYQIREFVDAGGLMSYGLNYCKHYERSAYYVDRILKGAKPADLPVELPASFELVINRKAAGAIGLALPKSLLIRADEVIG